MFHILRGFLTIGIIFMISNSAAHNDIVITTPAQYWLYRFS